MKTQITSALIIALSIIFVEGCARDPLGVPMEQAMCLESRHAILVVTGRNERNEYENSLCPIHRTKPISRCIKFTYQEGCIAETKPDPIK